jgi:hypothetical protein
MTRFHRTATAVLWVGTLLAIALMMRGLTSQVHDANHKADVAQRHAVASEKDQRASNLAVAELAKQVRSLGAQPVVEPSQLPQVGATGATGLTGATGAQGLRGLRGLRGRVGPVGGMGLTGADGPKGEPGKDGQDGKDGADGAPGPAGYPTSFSFTSIGGQSVTCDDTDGDHNYTCLPN